MTVDQRKASAGRDLVGRDKVVINLPADRALTKVEKLNEKLRLEMANDMRAIEVMERLQNYRVKIPLDGIAGLEAKLEFSGRSDQTYRALEMKELFAKLLDKWSLYASAQEIFLHLLAMTDHKFNFQVAPRLAHMDRLQIDEIVEEKVISPAIEEVGVGPIMMDHELAMGMVYWLAEQCRIKWHV
nr:ABC-three component system protein [Stenotrophomonas geniculata]